LDRRCPAPVDCAARRHLGMPVRPAPSHASASRLSCESPFVASREISMEAVGVVRGAAGSPPEQVERFRRGAAGALQAPPEQVKARNRQLELFRQTPLPPQELATNLGLYLRSTVVAKILYLNELYTNILHLPGVVMEFGCWWG